MRARMPLAAEIEILSMMIDSGDGKCSRGAESEKFDKFL
jgi:hypothetical protein